MYNSNRKEANTKACHTTDKEKGEKTMSIITIHDGERFHLDSIEYNMILIMAELRKVVAEHGGKCKAVKTAVISNRSIASAIRKNTEHLERLQNKEADNPNTNKFRPGAIASIKADLEKLQALDNTPRTVPGAGYVSFVYDGMYYYYQIDSNPFFPFYYQKTAITADGTRSLDACLEEDQKEWLYDCFLGWGATDADREEAAKQIFDMLIKAKPSTIRRDSRRERVPNRYDGGYHYETIYKKERREAVNF